MRPITKINWDGCLPESAENLHVHGTAQDHHGASCNWQKENHSVHSAKVASGGWRPSVIYCRCLSKINGVALASKQTLQLHRTNADRIHFL
jgi:hypothetical protein